MNKKIYEIPSLMVTELETEDIITESALIDQDFITDINAEDVLGYVQIEVDFE